MIEFIIAVGANEGRENRKRGLAALLGQPRCLPAFASTQPK
ncbi:MAG TPA: hypothetical protein VHY82_06450 [Acetobacteraceae bacterium]|nr:hypothetical protein [Acetobacteraceae bacterium]